MGTEQSVLLMAMCMGKHMSDVEGVFENAFVVLLEMGDQRPGGSKQWKNVLGLILQSTQE